MRPAGPQSMCAVCSRRGAVGRPCARGKIEAAVKRESGDTSHWLPASAQAGLSLRLARSTVDLDSRRPRVRLPSLTCTTRPRIPTSDCMLLATPPCPSVALSAKHSIATDPSRQTCYSPPPSRSVRGPSLRTACVLSSSLDRPAEKSVSPTSCVKLSGLTCRSTRSRRQPLFAPARAPPSPWSLSIRALCPHAR